MTQEKITGVILRVNEWASGKGYFATLEGQDEELYGFGTSPFLEGESYEITVSEGTGNFSDKLKVDETKKMVSVQTKSRVEPKPPPRKASPSASPGSAPISETDVRIARSVALKAANELVHELTLKHENIAMRARADEVIEIARVYEAYLLE